MEDFKFENGWDYYPFKICGCYLSALINNDSSGLDDEDIALFNKWEKEQVELVKNAETFTGIAIMTVISGLMMYQGLWLM